MEKLFVMKVLNEESGSKLKVMKCQPSIDGDYLGIVWEGKAFSIIKTLPHFQ